MTAPQRLDSAGERRTRRKVLHGSFYGHARRDCLGAIAGACASRERLFRVPVGGREVLRRTAVALYTDNCLGLAAQLAYYFFLALFPALLCLVALASFFPLEELVPELVESARWFFPEDVVRILRDQLAEISRGNHGGILTFGVLAAFWSSSAALMAIIDTLNRAYGVEESRPWWKTRLLAIALTVALAVFIVVSFTLVMLGPTVIRVLTASLGGGPVLAWAWAIARWPVAFCLIAVGIGLIYYFAPDVEQQWVWLTPGSALATAAWILASLGFKLYVVNLGSYAETYGAIGGG
ncbi:MAG: YihY/virulence factor BrkB family protein [Candidatus Rokubacteria bacterium]|nr:YihY/virulence factor BrkB family protein [Candidatus Rokubacteria bacterium]